MRRGHSGPNPGALPRHPGSRDNPTEHWIGGGVVSQNTVDHFHTPPVRIIHWIMGPSELTMVGGGWPIFPFTLPERATLGGDVAAAQAIHGDPGGAIAWHFAGMGTLVLVWFGFVSWGMLSGRSLSLGALTFQTGCDISDAVRAWLFDSTKLAPTFSETEVVRNVRFNTCHQADRAPVLEAMSCRLTLAGPFAGKTPRTFLGRIGAGTAAKYARFECADGYYQGLDMRTAPRTRGFRTDRGHNWFSGI